MLDALPLIPLFAGLSADQNTMLMLAFEKFVCPPHTHIFEQGEPAEYLYLILKGSAAIIYKPYDGPPLILTNLKDGDVFGWSAVVGGRKYSSSVVSNTALEAIRVHRSRLLDLVEKQPDTGSIIIDRLALNVSPRWKDAHSQIKPLIKERK